MTKETFDPRRFRLIATQQNTHPLLLWFSVAIPPVLPSGSVINAKNTLRSFDNPNPLNEVKVRPPEERAGAHCIASFPPPVLPSGETITAKNTLKSYVVPTSTDKNREAQQLPNEDGKVCAAASFGASPSGDAVYAKKSVHVNARPAAAVNNDVEFHHEPPRQYEAVQHPIEARSTDTRYLPVAIEAHAVADTFVASDSMPPQQRKGYSCCWCCSQSSLPQQLLLEAFVPLGIAAAAATEARP